MVYKFFDKKSASLADKSASGSGIKKKNVKQRVSWRITQINY